MTIRLLEISCGSTVGQLLEPVLVGNVDLTLVFLRVVVFAGTVDDIARVSDEVRCEGSTSWKASTTAAISPIAHWEGQEERVVASKLDASAAGRVGRVFTDPSHTSDEPAYCLQCPRPGGLDMPPTVFYTDTSCIQNGREAFADVGLGSEGGVKGDKVAFCDISAQAFCVVCGWGEIVL